MSHPEDLAEHRRLMDAERRDGLAQRKADTQAAMRAVDEEDAALDKARAETRRASARREARLQPARDRRSRRKIEIYRAIIDVAFEAANGGASEDDYDAIIAKALAKVGK